VPHQRILYTCESSHPSDRNYGHAVFKLVVTPVGEKFTDALIETEETGGDRAVIRLDPETLQRIKGAIAVAKAGGATHGGLAIGGDTVRIYHDNRGDPFAQGVTISISAPGDDYGTSVFIEEIDVNHVLKQLDHVAGNLAPTKPGEASKSLAQKIATIVNDNSDRDYGAAGWHCGQEAIEEIAIAIEQHAG
jgi:hypothetical protein